MFDTEIADIAITDESNELGLAFYGVI